MRSNQLISDKYTLFQLRLNSQFLIHAVPQFDGIVTGNDCVNKKTKPSLNY